MQRVIKKREKILKTTETGRIVNDEVKDHGSDPFFVKKTEAAKKMLDKYGVPKGFTSNK